MVAASVGVLALLLLAIVFDDGPRGSTTAAAPTAQPLSPPAGEPATASPSPAPGCTYVPSGTAARAVTLPPPEPGPEPVLDALLRTSLGDIDVVLDAGSAPCAVHSLRALAAAGFYDGTPCHRLVDRGIFALQCGDPTGTGSGGPGYLFEEEALDGATYARGTVAMVNSGPGTTGSQFFLFYDDSPLPAQYTPIGTIADPGLAVLDRIAAAGAGPVTEAGVTPPALPVQLLTVLVTPPTAPTPRPTAPRK